MMKRRLGNIYKVFVMKAVLARLASKTFLSIIRNLETELMSWDMDNGSSGTGIVVAQYQGPGDII